MNMNMLLCMLLLLQESTFLHNPNDHDRRMMQVQASRQPARDGATPTIHHHLQ